MSSVKLTERVAARVTILDIEGDITVFGGASELRKEVRRLIQDGRINIILNLAGVRYVDSSGLGAMVAALTTAIREGGKVALLNVSRNVLELLEITKLTSVFEIYGDERYAAKTIAEGRGV